MNGFDAKRLVSAGYDIVAARYLDWSSGSRVRLRYLKKLLDLLPPEHGQVLELGCGAGVPVACALAERAHVTGVDISSVQIERARQAVPKGDFLCADMMSVAFPPARFDVVAAFYAITHLPRSEHAELLDRILTWLRPGGWLLASFGSRDCADAVVSDWLGAPNFFSHFDATTNRGLVQAAGFEIVQQAILPQDEAGEDGVAFLWVIARKPGV
jgi:SAM-dependent methyltransferase